MLENVEFSRLSCFLQKIAYLHPFHNNNRQFPFVCLSVCLFVCLSVIGASREHDRDKRFLDLSSPRLESKANRKIGPFGLFLGLGSRGKSRKKGQNSKFFFVFYVIFFRLFYESRCRETQKKWFRPLI